MRIVYILTNQSMPELVKIGHTDNLIRRMKELDKTGTPLPFECFYAVEIKDEDAKIIEKKLHEGFDDKRIRKSREFFRVNPEQAKSILEIVKLMGGKDVTPTEDIIDSPEDKQALEKERKIRTKFNFHMVNIKPGESLEFEKDINIKCEVKNENEIIFENNTTSLSAAAHIILKKMGYDWLTVHGPSYWCYKGKKLSDLRNEQE
jgi:hypothetical protein|tara:strand:- start:282 stop:893 length:612 start_codon:yes stop_codon:yes gene_type:complete